MDSTQYIGLFICTTVTIVFFILLHRLFRFVYRVNGNCHVSSFSKEAIDSFLSVHFHYYRFLSVKGKEKFIRRVTWFRDNKQFYGKDGLVVNEEMKIFIGACFTQLTFGLLHYQLNSYRKIFLYPDVFYSGLLKSDVKGLSFKHTAVHLSWKNFKEGYDNPDDKINLGLHELAHALKFDLEDEEGFDNHFAYYVNEWKTVSETEFREMENERPSFLRAYGGANREEFFAVCVEHFFEAPAAFEKELPDIYNHLCFLLNQNPLNQIGDYMISEDFLSQVNSNDKRVPIKINKRVSFPQQEFYRWSFIALIVGVFTSVPTHFILSTKLFIYDSFLFDAAIFVFMIGLVQIALFRINGFDNLLYFVVYNFFGCVFSSIAVFVVINFALGSDVLTTHAYLVKHIEIVKHNNNEPTGLVFLNNGALENYKRAREFHYNELHHLTKKMIDADRVFFLVQTSRGFWDVGIILHKELLLMPENKPDTLVVNPNTNRVLIPFSLSM